MEVVRSIHGIPIRLTAERWMHIVENHDDMAGHMEDVLDAVAEPDWVTQGYGGALVAWKGAGRNRWLAVFYKELKHDGFVITAFVTHKPQRKRKTWP